MKITHDFVGGPLNGQQKDLDQSELPLTVTGGTYRRSGPDGGPAVALFWPDADNVHGPGDPIAKGEPFAMDLHEEGDCPAMQVDSSGAFVSVCVLDEGHGGPHVASDGEIIVQVWS